MRVLHILHTSLPFICGYSIRSDYIFRCQKEQGMDVAVVTSAQHPNGEAMQEEIDGIPYWRTPALTGKQLPVLREAKLMSTLRGRLERVVAEWKPDILHAHSPMLVGLPAMKVARKIGKPVVYEVRDLWENASVDRGKFGDTSLRYQAARRLETYLLRRADAVVTICEKLREELAPRVGRDDRLFVVDNGVDAANFQPDTPAGEARERWCLQDKKVIGYIGTFQPYEGLDVLINALPAIVKQDPAAHLVITGSGGEEANLRAQATEMGLDNHVTFTGRVPHDQVGQLYAMADMMVYPRILTRTTALTTPLKPLEAMAMGKPVLVSDVAAMRELVQPGVTGGRFQAGNAEDLAAQCLKLLQASEERQRLGRQAREWILQERQWPTLVKRYHEIYRAAAR
ncbi:MAG TPA: TIGR04063 family PEP-CTERM/XrtA system glycosyltransferase [Chthonomonadaceae bacterium]|nr:TIGR04063 family PEP-CTERM/XrtA system glycosyltransferase [Chthonomonadaceae bacterium]